MMSTEEILSSHDQLLHHFQMASGSSKNLFIYKKGTPFETSLALEHVPQTAQDYFELALKIEVEMHQLKIADAEIQEFYAELAADMPSQEKIDEELQVTLKKAESIFFMKTKQAHTDYQKRLLQIDIATNPYFADELRDEMLFEVNAAVTHGAELIRKAIVSHDLKKQQLAKATSSQTLFEKVINFKNTPKSLLVSNLLMDAAMAGHVWASVVIKAQLSEIKLSNGVSIWLPRKLLPHELYKLKADLAQHHEGFYYRAASAEQAEKIRECLFVSHECLI